MDPYSFLNTAHSAYFAELYDQYLINPESVEPSWRAFFQGFEFGIDKVEKGELHIPENILKEFKVVKLINGYRTRGHLFTRTNPVRDRRSYMPTLELENFCDSYRQIFGTGLDKNSNRIQLKTAVTSG